MTTRTFRTWLHSLALAWHLPSPLVAFPLDFQAELPALLADAVIIAAERDTEAVQLPQLAGFPCQTAARQTFRLQACLTSLLRSVKQARLTELLFTRGNMACLAVLSLPTARARPELVLLVFVHQALAAQKGLLEHLQPR